MTALDFVARYIESRITATGGIGGECVDLANQWLMDAYGIAHVYRNAVDWAGGGKQRMVWTANAPLNSPLKGSLVVWQETPSRGIGPDGHIALVLASDRMHILTFDQNWPEGEPCSVNLHSYAGILGWQTPV